MAPQDMDEANGKRQPAWKLRLPWEQQRLEEAQKSAFIQNETAEASTSSISTIARAFLLSRRRLRLDPDKKLHFLCKFQNLACPSLSSFAARLSYSSQGIGFPARWFSMLLVQSGSSFLECMIGICRLQDNTSHHILAKTRTSSQMVWSWETC